MSYIEALEVLRAELDAALKREHMIRQALKFIIWRETNATGPGGDLSETCRFANYILAANPAPEEK